MDPRIPTAFALACALALAKYDSEPEQGQREEAVLFRLQPR